MMKSFDSGLSKSKEMIGLMPGNDMVLNTNICDVGIGRVTQVLD